MSAIRMYYQSFNYNKQTIYQECLGDLTARLGGWTGLCLGGSMISSMEITGFVVLLIYKLYHRRWSFVTNLGLIKYELDKIQGQWTWKYMYFDFILTLSGRRWWITPKCMLNTFDGLSSVHLIYQIVKALPQIEILVTMRLSHEESGNFDWFNVNFINITYLITAEDHE